LKEGKEGRKKKKKKRDQERGTRRESLVVLCRSC
jgi:hypothetical protein